MRKKILSEFEKARPALVSMETVVEGELRRLLAENDIKIHSLTTRVKEAASLSRKLGRPDRTYQALDEVTDVIGARITTYFEDTIEEIATLVERELEIDYNHSVDKRQDRDSARFGYRSLHYVCRLKGRVAADQPPFRFELQIRTILQHAWAEIEHDLGYKTEESIPLEIRRRFSRVASLLEVADAEFLAIRKSLAAYRENIHRRLTDPGTPLAIDQDSLEEFLMSDEATAIEGEFAAQIGVSLSDESFYPDYLIRMLKAVGVNSLGHLRESLLEHRLELLSFIRPYFEFTRKTWQFDGKDVETFLRGYSLVFLAHFLLVKTSSLAIERLDRLAGFYSKIDYPDDEKTARAVARTLIDTLHDQFDVKEKGTG